MPNTSVRAAAEGMPNLNRRSLLLGAAAISTAVAMVAVVPEAHAATSLEEAIAKCQRAEEAYGVCIARENAVAEALGDKLFPKWTPPGGLMSIWSQRPNPFSSSAELEEEIARKLDQVDRSWASSCMDRAAYNRWMASINRARDEGLSSLHEQEATIEASGYHRACSATDDALNDWGDAFDAVLRHPCRTMEEVKAKSACLLHRYEVLGAAINGEELFACLSSFCVEG